MAQWDVYANPSPRAREELPFLVDVQSNLLSGLRTRFVVPCAPAEGQLERLPRRMSPEFDIGGRRVLLVPHEAGPMDAALLHKPVASLRAQSHLVIDAFDAVIGGV